MARSVQDIARFLGGRAPRRLELAEQELLAIAAPGEAAGGDLTFWIPELHSLTEPGFVQATAILAEAIDTRTPEPDKIICVPAVDRACAQVIAWLSPRGPRSGSQASRAQARGEACDIHPSAIIGEGVRLGGHCVIGPGAVVTGRTALGNRVRIGPGAVIGADGFAAIRDGPGWLHMPCFGGVVIGDDARIGAQSVVHAGVFSDTRIGHGAMLDSHVLIGHDAVIGEKSALAGGTVVGGAARLGRICRVGGQCAIAEGVQLADEVTVTGGSTVTRSLKDTGTTYSSTWPAIPAATWWKQLARFKTLLARESRRTQGGTEK